MSRPELRHAIRITDTTLRDGSHAMAHQFTLTQVRDTVRALDDAGIEVIEVSHGDGLGGSSFNYGFSRTHEMELIEAARDTARNARIAVLLVPGIGTVNDLRRAHDAGAEIVRIATHCTEADVSVQHFTVGRELGMETVGFLMMAHRTTPRILAAQARIMVDAGCQCPYVTDSAGALLMEQAKARFEALIEEVGDEAWVGYHGHPVQLCKQGDPKILAICCEFHFIVESRKEAGVVFENPIDARASSGILAATMLGDGQPVHCFGRVGI